MITLFLIFLPLAGLLAVWLAGDRLRVHVGVINLTALLHCAGTALLWVRMDWDSLVDVSELVGQDALSLVILSVVSLLFLLSGLFEYLSRIRFISACSLAE